MALMEIMNRGKISRTGKVTVKKGSYKEKPPEKKKKR